MGFTFRKCLKTHSGFITSLIILSKTELVSGSLDYIIKIWDLGTLNCVKTIRVLSDKIFVKLSKKLILCSSFNDYSIKIIKLSNEEISQNFKGYNGSVTSIAKLSKTLIASGGYDASIKIRDIETEECLKTLDLTDIIRIIVKLNKYQIVSGSYCLIKIWDFEMGQCTKTLNGHTEDVLYIVKLSKTKLLSGSEDCSIKIWDSLTGTCLTNLKTTSSVTYLVKINKTQIVSGSEVASIKLWDLF